MPKTPLDKAVDDVTGHTDSIKKNIRDIVTRIKRLKGKWSKETGKPAPTEMEDKILEALG